ncbi:MAG: glycosyltransferase [Cyanobacteria bacterium]|nr:glycosyltransferase [Cyanobacteriota bacterium]
MMQPYVEDQDILMVQSALALKPDVIHVHDLPSLTAGFILKDWLQVPLVYDMHEFFPEQEFISAESKAFYYQKERYLMPMVDIAYTVNPLLAKEIEEEYSIPVGSIQNSTVELPGFDLVQKHNRFREEYGLPEDSILVLYQGLISPVRNNEPFIEGMKLLKDTPFILLFMGYGDEQYLKQLQTLIDSSGLSEKVYLIPSKSQDELLYYSASADIGLIPYYNKPSKNIKYVSPNKLYEFIAAGLPILSNELEFVKSVIEPQGFGQCANLESPEGFAQALKGFPIDKLPHFKQNLREKRHLYMWDAESVKLVEFYQTLKLPNATIKEKETVTSF